MPNVSLVGHHHTCPAKQGKAPHVGGAINSGQSACTVNGVPVAIVGDTCTCNVGGPDTITSGHASLTIDGIPVAIVGSSTAHGGSVVEGDANLTVE
ncbi:MAG: PAAR domain-containing protein [Leucothrix sp.]